MVQYEQSHLLSRLGGSYRHQPNGTIRLVMDTVDAGATLTLHDLHVERRGFDRGDVRRLAGWTPKHGRIDGHHDALRGFGSREDLRGIGFRPCLRSSVQSIHTGTPLTNIRVSLPQSTHSAM
jgi:hypothetical protein